MTVHNPELVDILDAQKPIHFEESVWRTTWKGRSPLEGGAGGRWCGDKNIAVLYTSLKKDISLAELYFHLSLAPVFSSCTVLIHEIRVNRIRLLDLTSSDLLRELGVDDSLPDNEEYSKSQEIGEVAYFLHFQGILVPSKRHFGNNCVLFPELIDPNGTLTVVNEEDVNWPAWKEKLKS